ncbi:MAG: SIR2 family NAD-dependent protein deacylase, partial [Bacilli bacterium]
MEQLKHVAAVLRNANGIVVFTGAGMSTESGVPDFRSALRGLYTDGAIQRLTHVSAIETHTEEWRAFYQRRIRMLADVEYHIGYRILANWKKRMPVLGFITQNVDGLHEQAGNYPLCALHGSITTIHCHTCSAIADQRAFLNDEHCHCGGTLRPSVVMFGEGLDEATLMQATDWTKGCDVMIVLGSSLVVSPANRYPMMAKQLGATLIIVNEEATPLDDTADFLFPNMKIGDWLRSV